VLHRALTRGGINVTQGKDGRDIINLCVIEGRKFDVLLVDETMQDMNGSTAVRALRAHESKAGLAPVPVFATTGNTAPHDLIYLYAHGLDGILGKPMALREIVATLNAYVAFRKRHALPDDPTSMTYGAGLMTPLEEDEVGKDKVVQLRSNGAFENSLVFGGLEVFGAVRENMQGAVAAAVSTTALV
jgi:DNA-binding response OmpR family regulator